MSIIFDALKKAQARFISQHAKGSSSKESKEPKQPEIPKPKPQQQPATSPSRIPKFSPGEDLTQAIRPLAGAKPIVTKEKVVEDKKRPARPTKKYDWVIYNIRNMNPFAFLAMILVGLLGSALVFYIFSVKFKNRYLIQSPGEGETSSGETDATAESEASRAKEVKKNLFYLSPEVSLALDGIVSSEGENLALIDDQIIKVGDTIKGATVVSIGANQVVLSFHGKEIILTIK